MEPTRAEIRRWRHFLAAERAEASVYRDLASRRSGDEREILLALADAEGRHETHWRNKLGDRAGTPGRGDPRTRLLALLARRFGWVFVLALMQRAESRSPYDRDAHATEAMAADERIHGEVVRALATRGRNRVSGTFRAAVFGANDGLVSNLALVLGVTASGASTRAVLTAGLAGLLAGALSMGAGEYVSVRSQRELLDASRPDPGAGAALSYLDADANELTLVYRARGLSAHEAESLAAAVLRDHTRTDAEAAAESDRGRGQQDLVGTGAQAALSSFAFFASGALVPVLPYLVGLTGTAAVVVATTLVGLALLGTGAVVGLLSGGPPLPRAGRQLAIGYGAAAATYLLGLAVGTGLG